MRSKGLQRDACAALVVVLVAALLVLAIVQAARADVVAPPKSHSPSPAVSPQTHAPVGPKEGLSPVTVVGSAVAATVVAGAAVAGLLRLRQTGRGS